MCVVGLHQKQLGNYVQITDHWGWIDGWTEKVKLTNHHLSIYPSRHIQLLTSIQFYNKGLTNICLVSNTCVDRNCLKTLVSDSRVS